MDPRLLALRTGVRRSPQDQGFYVFMGLGVLALLFFNRGETMEGTGLSFAQVVLPSLLAGVLVFSIVIGPAYALALEREDGTLLRSRVAPYGLHGYLTGVATLSLVSLLPLLVIILGGSSLMFPGVLPADVGRLASIAAAMLLGVAATLPLGFVIGSVVPRINQVTTWGMLPIIALAQISGVFGDMSDLWDWVQVLAQVFPLYWVGHLLRYAFLPETASVVELYGTWRVGAGVGVLLAWSVLGTALAVPVVRRMTRRQSGAAVAEARDGAAQHVR